MKDEPVCPCEECAYLRSEGVTGTLSQQIHTVQYIWRQLVAELKSSFREHWRAWVLGYVVYLTLVVTWYVMAS